MFQQNQNLSSNQAPVTSMPTAMPVTVNTASIEQAPAYQPKRKWWLYVLLVFIFVLLGLGGWWYYAKYTPKVKMLAKVKEIVDIDSIIDGQELDNFIFFDTRKIEVNSQKERINEFSFLAPKEMELVKFSGATVYFKKNDSNLALNVMAYKIDGETDQNTLAGYNIVLENGKYTFNYNKNLLLYREDFTLFREKIETGGKEVDYYMASLLKDDYFIRVGYADFNNIEEESLEVIDIIIDSLQNYGAVGYSGEIQEAPEGYKLFDSKVQVNNQTKEGDSEISFYYPESFDTIKYEPGIDPEVEMLQSVEPRRYMIISTLEDNEKVRDGWFTESTSCDDHPDPVEECQVRVLDNFSIKQYVRTSGEDERIELYGKIGNRLIFIVMKELADPYVPEDEIAILVNIFNTIQIQAAETIVNTDSDGDGLSDQDELKYGTEKNNPDSDNDGYLDGQEVNNGYNPLGLGLLEIK